MFVSSTILIGIQHIHFPCLVALKLRKNDILSLEVLDRIRMPHLRKLWLDDNRIIHVPQKCCFPSMDPLSSSFTWNTLKTLNLALMPDGCSSWKQTH